MMVVAQLVVLSHLVATVYFYFPFYGHVTLWPHVAMYLAFLGSKTDALQSSSGLIEGGGTH